MRTIGWLRGGLVALTCLLAAPAVADIKSFNAAIVAKDYKKAAAEAAATWPTLDKSRPDLAIIAREFGFAAYLAGDYPAVKTYGEAAVRSGTAEEPELQASSEILVRLAEHKLAPSKASRDALFSALDVRAETSGVDLISYFAAEAITVFDYERAAWKDAAASARLAAELAKKGGELYLVQAHRFDLYAGVSDYWDTKQQPAYDQLEALRERVIASINAAASDEAAAPLVELYWDLRAWSNSIRSHLAARRKLKEDEDALKGAAQARSINDRAVRLLSLSAEDKPCQMELRMRRDPEYPSSALYKGLIGTVLLQVDVGADGKVSNPNILASVPGEHFGSPVMKSVKDMRYQPGDKWGAGCSLAQAGRVVIFSFTVR